jgi:hypothetical protein
MTVAAGIERHIEVCFLERGFRERAFHTC